MRGRASFQHRLQDDLAGLGALQHSQAPGLRTGGPPCCVSETLSGRSGVASVWCHPVSVCKMLMRRKGAAGSLSRRPGSSVFTLGQGLGFYKVESALTDQCLSRLHVHCQSFSSV